MATRLLQRSRSRSPRTGGVDEAGQILCHVTQLSGEHLPSVLAELRETVAVLKQRLAGSAATPVKYMRLLLGSKELKNENALAEEGMTGTTTLTFIRCNPDVSSFLHLADDDEHVVPFLANCSADPNELDENGWTALHWAAYRALPATCLALANSSLFSWALNCKDFGGATVLHACSQRGLFHACQALLQRDDFLLANDRAASGFTALLTAARSGHESVCLALLDSARYEAVNEENFRGWTALHYAAAGGLSDLCRSLLTDSRFTGLHTLSNNGESALHWAAMYGHLDVCKLLLENGVDAALQDVEGETALDGAKINKRKEVCELLCRWLEIEVPPLEL